MKLEASILIDCLAEFSCVTRTSHLGVSFEWIDVLDSSSTPHQTTLYACSPETIEEYAKARVMPSTDDGMHLLLVVNESKCKGNSRAKQLYDQAAHVGQVVAVCSTDLPPARVAKLLQKRLREVNEWLLDMDHCMLSGGMYQSVLDLSLPILGNRLIVTDCDYRILATAGSGPVGVEMFDAALERGYFDETDIGRFVEAGILGEKWVPVSRKFPKHERTQIDGVTLVDHAFFISNTFCCYLMMVCNVRKPTRGLERLLYMLTEAIAHCAAKDWSRNARLSSSLGRFWHSLLVGDFPSGDQLAAMCAARDLPTLSTFRVCAFEFDGEVLPRFMSDAVQAALGSPSYALAKGYRVTAVCFGDWVRSRTFIERKSIRELMKFHHMRVGISVVYNDIADTPLAYRQAIAALEAGAPEVWVPEGATEGVLFFDRCTFPWLLGRDEGADCADDLDFLVRTNPLLRLGESEGSDFICDRELLACFLQHNCDATITAKSLGVHRNTVYNRMRSISKKLDVDLNDVQLRIYLHFMFALAQDGQA